MEDKKPCILFLSGWYPSRTEPFLGNFVQKHAETVALKSNVAALHVCSDPQLKDRTYEVVSRNINGIFTVNVYYRKVTHGIPLLSQLQKMQRYRKAHRLGLAVFAQKGWEFDLVHLNILWPAGLIARMIRKEQGIPYIITEHSTAYQPARRLKRSWYERWQSRRIARDAALITTVSKDLEKGMRELGLENDYYLVNNVVDTDLFKPALARPEGRYCFLHVSTVIDEHKNVSGMLRAVAALAAECNDFELHIVTDGDPVPHIAYAKKLGIYEKTVRFSGPQDPEHIAAIMQKSDCLVQFSNYENMPVVIAEAFSAGIPVISTAVGGIPEHIDEQRGLLIQAGDEKALVSSMKQMMERRGSYSSARLHQYAEDQFSTHRVCERFHAIYRKVLDKV